MTNRVLITGHTGNVGMACVSEATARMWHFDGINTSTVPLTNWEATSQYIKDRKPYDLVIMTHGTQKMVTLANANLKTWEYIVGNNLEAATSLTTAIMAHGKLNQGGLIVYCSSIQASQPRSGRGLYGIAKAGVEALTRSAAVELEPVQGRAIALRLGQMSKQMKGIHFDDETAQKLRSLCLLPWVTPAEVARFCFHLYELGTITGEVIEISSGQAFNIWG